MNVPIGTLVNAAAVLAGSGIGLALKTRLPERIQAILFMGLGLCTLTIGAVMVQKTADPLFLVLAILLGGITGELLALEKKLEKLGNFLKHLLSFKDEQFTEGLVTAFLIFCVGSVTINGVIDEGVRGDASLLLVKSTLDGFCSIALAARYGAGVLVSALPLLIFQGALTLLAVWAQGFFTPLMLSQLTAAGGVLVLGIGLNLLELKKIPTANFLPALVYIAIFSALFPK